MVADRHKFMLARAISGARVVMPTSRAPEPKPLPTGWRLWLAGARSRTLPAAIVPVLVGTACAASVPRWLISNPRDQELYSLVTAPGGMKGITLWRMFAAMLVALAIQVGTNFANDYSDGKRGTDDPTKRVGPPRLVGWGLATPGAVKQAAFMSFGLAAFAGLALAYAVTWWLIPLGAICFAAGWLYTGGSKPYGYAGFGELFVFVFFGLVATVGSAYVQTGHLQSLRDPDVLNYSYTYPWLTVGAAVCVGLLATALLVINNLRDISSETDAGKRTLAVKLGDGRTRVLYVALLELPLALAPLVCVLAGRPQGAVCVLAGALSFGPIMQVFVKKVKGPALVPVLQATARLHLVFGVLLAAGLFLSA